MPCSFHAAQWRGRSRGTGSPHLDVLSTTPCGQDAIGSQDVHAGPLVAVLSSTIKRFLAQNHNSSTSLGPRAEVLQVPLPPQKAQLPSVRGLGRGWHKL